MFVDIQDMKIMKLLKNYNDIKFDFYYSDVKCQK